MEDEKKEGKVIAYTRSGKAIYDKHNHPAHGNLSSTELQSLMFHYFDQAAQHAMKMKRHSPGSIEHEFHRTQMYHDEIIHKHIAKLWRSLLKREKKLSKPNQ